MYHAEARKRKGCNEANEEQTVSNLIEDRTLVNQKEQNAVANLKEYRAVLKVGNARIFLASLPLCFFILITLFHMWGSFTTCRELS